MLAPLTFMSNPMPGIERYYLQDIGTHKRTLPDLMQVRCYISGRIFLLEKPKLPCLWDVIEYDYRLEEWFIVKMRGYIQYD